MSQRKSIMAATIAAPGRLSKCIRTVHEGQIWVGNQEIEHLVAVLTEITPTRILKSGSMPFLTQREAEVVCLLAEGRGSTRLASNSR